MTTTIMATTVQTLQSPFISTIDALWALIQAQPKRVREALSKKMAEDAVCTKNIITPAIAKQIRKARKEYSRGETIRCESPEEMQQFFDSL